MDIIIHGQTPAQKNNKNVGRNKYTNKTFVTSSDTVKKWQENALIELSSFTHKFSGRVVIDYMFYVKDDVQRDLDNMIASVNDILQVANAAQEYKRGKMRPIKKDGIIQGDNWQLLKLGSADAMIDRNDPRCVITINQV